MFGLLGRCTGAGIHFQCDGLVAAGAHQDLRLVEFFLEMLHLFRGEGTKTVLSQPIDKERAKDAAIAALNTAVERQAHANAVVIADNGNGSGPASI